MSAPLPVILPFSVIPAKAGISGRTVTAMLDETPAFAGVTRAGK